MDRMYLLVPEHAFGQTVLVGILRREGLTRDSGIYDDEYIDYVIKVLQKCRDYDFKVFIDPHQDVWSRWTGGSGAPYWTMTMIGLNPRNFADTGAAFVQNTHPNPAEFPKMIWPTNYTKLACATMFTLFFGGKTFAPECMLPNDLDGHGEINVQDWLQGHYISAIARLAIAITQAGLNDSCVMGYDTLNEPNKGYISRSDIMTQDKHVPLLAGHMPTAYQSMVLGEGIACHVETYGFGTFGPTRIGDDTLDPRGKQAWFMSQDEVGPYDIVHPSFIGRGCIWKQHEVWQMENGHPKVLKRDYFCKHPTDGSSIDFLAEFWKPFVARMTASMRSVHRWAIMFVEPPVNEAPPRWDDEADDEAQAAREDWVVQRTSVLADDADEEHSYAVDHRAEEIQFESRNDRRMVYAPHWYDGLTLMQKSFNSRFNVDILGLLRNQYYSSMQALALGQSSVRNVFASQLKMVVDDGRSNLGNHPTVMGEFGIPYDMANGKSYLPGGNYNQQTLALDFNMTGMERNLLNYTIWTYVSDNTHQWGDGWNGEDLSIFCRDEQILAFKKLQDEEYQVVNKRDKRFSHETVLSEAGLTNGHAILTRNQVLRTSQDTLLNKNQLPVILVDGMDPIDPFQDLNLGGRGLSAFVRPFPMAAAGRLERFAFDLTKREFTLSFKHRYPATLSTDDPLARLMSRAEMAQAMTTDVFLPDLHYPKLDDLVIETDEGHLTIERRPCQGVGEVNVLIWKCGCWDKDPVGEKSIIHHSLRISPHSEPASLMGRLTRWLPFS